MQTLINGNSPGATAAIRALWTALITLGISTVTALQNDLSNRDAILAGLAVALPILIIRGVGEGVADQRRDNAGTVLPGDVTPNPPTP